MSTAIGLLKTTAEGLRWNTLPPAICSQPTFSKRIDVTGNFLIPADPLTFEKIPTSSGCLIWLPGRDMISAYRFGFVPAGTVSTGAGGGSPPVGLPGGALTYWSPLPIPYNNKVEKDIITYSPPPSFSTFTMGRLYYGKIKCISDTVPISATALNGQFAAAAVSNILDVFQVNQIPGVQSGLACDPSMLTQAGTTIHDSIKEVSVGRGATVLLGPDIEPKMAFADVNEIYNHVGHMTPGTELTGIYLQPFPYVATPLAANAQLFLWAGWISPWNVSVTGVALPGITLQNIPCAGYPAMMNPVGGAFEMNLTFSLDNTKTVPVPTGYEEAVNVYFFHTFATCSSDGSINYNVAQENRTITVGPSVGFDIPFVVRSNAKEGMTGGFSQYNNQNTSVPPFSPLQNFANQAGMYIGTSFAIFVKNVSDVAGADSPSHIDPLLPHYINFRAVNDYAPGELGPARIVRWDSVGAGQVMKVDGIMLAECLPGFLSAPFVQSSANMARVCTSINAYNFLAFVYNSDDTPFKRVWDSYYLDEFIRNELPKLSCHTIRSWGVQRIIDAAASCGILKEDSYEEQVDNPKRTKLNPYPTVTESEFKSNDMQESEIAPSRSATGPMAGGKGKDVGARLRNLDEMMEPIATARSRRQESQNNKKGYY